MTTGCEAAVKSWSLWAPVIGALFCYFISMFRCNPPLAAGTA